MREKSRKEIDRVISNFTHWEMPFVVVVVVFFFLFWPEISSRFCQEAISSYNNRKINSNLV